MMVLAFDIFRLLKPKRTERPEIRTKTMSKMNPAAIRSPNIFS